MHKGHNNLVPDYLKQISLLLGVENQNIIHAIERIILFPNQAIELFRKSFVPDPLRYEQSTCFSQKRSF